MTRGRNNTSDSDSESEVEEISTVSRRRGNVNKNPPKSRDHPSSTKRPEKRSQFIPSDDESTSPREVSSPHRKSSQFLNKTPVPSPRKLQDTSPRFSPSKYQSHTSETSPSESTFTNKSRYSPLKDSSYISSNHRKELSHIESSRDNYRGSHRNSSYESSMIKSPKIPNREQLRSSSPSLRMTNQSELRNSSPSSRMTTQSPLHNSSPSSRMTSQTQLRNSSPSSRMTSQSHSFRSSSPSKYNDVVQKKLTGAKKLTAAEIRKNLENYKRNYK